MGVAGLIELLLLAFELLLDSEVILSDVLIALNLLWFAKEDEVYFGTSGYPLVSFAVALCFHLLFFLCDSKLSGRV